MGTAYLLLPLALLAPPAMAQQALSPADQAAAFGAAGFKLEGRQWKACGDPGTAGYMPGTIERIIDLNGDGRPEAVIAEGSSFCFGATGTGYTIVGKQADGSWKRIAEGPGIVTVLATRSAGGWADIEIGGPGFCFPVRRWNGRSYVVVRHQYEGKACKPGN